MSVPGSQGSNVNPTPNGIGVEFWTTHMFFILTTTGNEAGLANQQRSKHDE